MERNLEREFGVDDAEAFIDLVTSFGCRETFAKVKAGLRFTHDGLTVELARVEGLGDFLEVECVVEDESERDATGEAALHRDTAARIGRSSASSASPTRGSNRGRTCSSFASAAERGSLAARGYLRSAIAASAAVFCSRAAWSHR